MAFAYLNPYARIWQANGLNYLLFPHELSPEEGLCALGTPELEALQRKGVGSSASSPQRGLSWAENGQVHKPLATPSRSASAQSPFMERNESNITSNDIGGRGDKAGRSDLKNTSPHQATAPESWPPVWQRQLQRTQKALFAWSYMALGSDLFSAGKEQGEDASGSALAQRKLRSQCLRKLLSDLSHPAGTHTFWPVALPENEDQSYLPNMDCFWGGLDALGCRGVIFLGRKAASAALGTDDLKPLSQMFKFGKLVWILWEPDEIARNPKVYNTVLPFLRRSLGQFVRI